MSLVSKYNCLLLLCTKCLNVVNNGTHVLLCDMLCTFPAWSRNKNIVYQHMLLTYIYTAKQFIKTNIYICV